MNKTENTNLLINLINEQVSNYKRAMELEDSLNNAITKQNPERIKRNTEKKAALMAKITPLAEKIAIAFQNEYEEKNSDLIQLRSEARNILDSINEQQQKNLEALNNDRESMLSNFREAKVAKQVAKGYKQETKIYRNRLDTKS